jgi:hypothetical protein
MHQSPLKQQPGEPRRDKYAAFDLLDGDEVRRTHRGSGPKARRVHLRAEHPREDRAEREPHARG